MIERESRVMAALESTAAPVADRCLLCEDSSIIGTPFYVLDHIDGRIFRDPAAPELDPAAAENAKQAGLLATPLANLAWQNVQSQ
jgi:aminoglycoside phosphotransferase (APT) family kinase protein